MNEQSVEQPIALLETQLEQAVLHFSYPPTPNIAGGVAQQLVKTPTQFNLPRRQLALSMLLVVLTIAVLLAISPMGTAVGQVLHQGFARLFLTDPLATGTPLATITPAASAESPAGVTPQSFHSTPRPSSTPISSIRDFTGAASPVEPSIQATLSVHSSIRSKVP